MEFLLLSFQVFPVGGTLSVVAKLFFFGIVCSWADYPSLFSVAVCPRFSFESKLFKSGVKSK